MRLRRFTGSDPAAALRAVKKALGPEAIILATRPCEHGVEITAAVDLDVSAEQDVAPAASDALQGELAEITRELRTIGARVARMEPEPNPGALPGRRLGGEGRAMAERLLLHGVAVPLATRVARAFQKGRASGVQAEAALEASLARHLAATEPETAPRVEAFVGPTGCGKTTTIAKLASAALSGGAEAIGFVMADTQRIGANAQLEAYARLLGARLEVAENAAQLGEALERLRDCDAVYVDTAGVGGDRASLQELQALLSGLGSEASVTAVVSTGLSASALERVWPRLESLGARECVVTKLDESPGLGATCSWVAETGMRLRWLGTGQRVPGDLTEASGNALAHWLLAA